MKWVAFLRGINVGGHRKVPMADLRKICVDVLGARDVRTYIASGNVVFAAAGTAHDLAVSLQEGIAAALGFDVPVLVLNADAMRAVLESCPFPHDSGKAVHAFLCYDTPRIDDSVVDKFRAPTEQLVTVGRTVWLYAPEGIGRSKLAEKLDVGVEVTARNLNTIQKMVDMLDA
ncbi:MAG: DUF1697 domain-containing protein [Pseudomonadota bacterium]